MSRDLTDTLVHCVRRILVRLRSGLLFVIVLGTVCVVLSSDASAGKLAGQYKEMNPQDFTASVQHGPVTRNTRHIVSANAPCNFKDKGHWKWDGEITELEKNPAGGDVVWFEFVALHETSPHAGEATPNLNPLAWIPIVIAGSPSYTKGLNAIGPVISTAIHIGGEHYDEGVLHGNVWVANNNLDIHWFVISIAGNHSKDSKHSYKGGGGIDPEEPVDSAFGAASWCVRPSTGDLVMGMSIMNVTLGEISAAHWRVGSPDAPGPVIYSVDAELFEAVDTTGVSLSISDGSFPLEYVDSLVAERTYLEIETPDGFLRGQMLIGVEDPPPPEWTIIWVVVVLAGILLLLVALYIWRRRIAVRAAG
ncbi:MAG: hypothetical protein OEV49_03385 [candidate division Zixibacteria bacterium]|nr:hypothetical protein [candidate division Zixibacteria bacterium]MDH3936584.1 hypothetical protein [candidate division Zixibacteria bacterium]MDH4034213.1 hypothetical protein [candidate division Zixibacteria bacterium]